MACRHHDIQEFDGLRFCLACGEAISELPLETEALSNSPAPYRYTPLRCEGLEIRLVVLFPGQESDDIHCDLIHVNLDDQPVYEAVSYTWATDGDASLSQSIQCQRHTLGVTKNCEAVLRYLRRQGRNRLLWIDAICINQADTAERNHQVKAMASIYSSASQVLAYLGPVSKAHRQAIHRVMGYLGDSSTGSYLNAIFVGRVNVEIFLSQPYFDRVWVLQEISLARLVTLIAGDREIQWNAITVEKIIRLCAAIRTPALSIFQWVPSSRPEENDLLYTLHKSRNCSSSDPRDKVFGVLGLARFEKASGLLVDYTLTPAEVFTKTATYLIETQQSLDVLKHASLGDIYIHDSKIPSWVPDWTVKNVYEPMPIHLGFTFSQKSEFASRWWSTLRDASHFDREEQLMEGITALTDGGTRSTATWRKLASKYLEHLKDLEKPPSLQDARGLGEYMSHTNNKHFQYTVSRCEPAEYGILSLTDKAAQSCLRIRGHCIGMIGGASYPITEHRRCILPRVAGPAFDGAGCCSSCADHTPKSSCSPKHTSKMQRKEFQSILLQLSKEYVFFSTEQSLGFTRERPHRGDTVWILSDAGFPFILRREGDHYVLVGECYIHRAGQAHPCVCCGGEGEPWSMNTEVIDIW